MLGQEHLQSVSDCASWLLPSQLVWWCEQFVHFLPAPVQSTVPGRTVLAEFLTLTRRHDVHLPLRPTIGSAAALKDVLEASSLPSTPCQACPIHHTAELRALLNWRDSDHAATATLLCATRPASTHTSQHLGYNPFHGSACAWTTCPFGSFFHTLPKFVNRSLVWIRSHG